jgi:hypothetical protein
VHEILDWFADNYPDYQDVLQLKNMYGRRL